MIFNNCKILNILYIPIIAITIQGCSISSPNLISETSDFQDVVPPSRQHEHIEYSVCFTPSKICGQMIEHEIDSAQRSIHVMAYGFTSVPITDALLRAKNRGINVEVILDKSNATEKKTIPYNFSSNNIPVYIDNKPPIAHNKVMIIDEELTITGSYNFTGNAQKNAENVIFLRDSEITKSYLNNWITRHKESVDITNYRSKKL